MKSICVFRAAIAMRNLLSCIRTRGVGAVALVAVVTAAALAGAFGVCPTSAAKFLGTVQDAPLGQLKTLYMFPGYPAGADSYAGLIEDPQGNLYGTTYSGGAFDGGTVFKFSSQGRMTVVYSFGENPNDGGGPLAGLVRDHRGNLYGTTTFGGQAGQGTVFKVNPSGQETVLLSFNGQDGSCPTAGVILDDEGNLYGTTAYGGNPGCEGEYGQVGCGVVFELNPKGQEELLWSFAPRGTGINPYGSLIRDSKGNLYGTTYLGGTYEQGTVFEIGSSGKQTVLYNFKGEPDSANPGAGLTQDPGGNFYCTTEFGGDNDFGTVFELGSSTRKESVIYSFRGGLSQAGTPDGLFPSAVVTLDAKGNIYGTTEYGGIKAYGTVFMIDSSRVETILWRFTGNNPGDGEYPTGGLLKDRNGNLYGTTPQGSVYDYGTIFEISR